MSSLSDALVVTSGRFANHFTPAGHPESPQRADVMTAVAKRWYSLGGRIEEPTEVEEELLTTVHSKEHVRVLEGTRGSSVQIDSDTYVSPESEVVARVAAGSAVAAIEHTLELNAPSVAFVRPPGHHAERSRAMGFCLYNNAAVAVVHALNKGLKRVAILDYDVHHGNGTQNIFYEDGRVLYLSIHQYPFYPGTGAASEVGLGHGEGLTVNVPLEAGAGDADYDLLFKQLVLPVLTSFEPELVMVSAGFDAHARDPLGGMRLSTEGYTNIVQHVTELADHCSNGRLVGVIEGGYDLTVLEECLTEMLGVLSKSSLKASLSTSSSLGTSVSPERAEAAIEIVRERQSAFWPAI